MNARAPSIPGKEVPAGADAEIRLRLYVTGATSLSLRAMVNIKSICVDYLNDLNPDLQIIDLYRDPASARAKQILAAPTLIKEFPLPSCRIIGDLSKKDRVLRSLGLPPPSPLTSSE